MYNNILVPVDGSKLAESVMPHVQAIATGCEVRSVTFLRVVEPFYMPAGAEGPSISQSDIDSFESKTMKEAAEYLAKLTGGLSYKSSIKTEVIKGHPAEIIADYAGKNGVDLIIISTHGRSGVSRWVWGSVADRVLRASCVPVFMIRAPGCVPGI